MKAVEARLKAEPVAKRKAEDTRLKAAAEAKRKAQEEAERRRVAALAKVDATTPDL